MSILDEIFEHKIGDVVRGVHRIDEEHQTFLSVSQRELEECPGGIQYHYICRPLHKEGVGVHTIKFNSVELEACDFKAEVVKLQEAKEERQRVDFERSQKMRNEVREMLKKSKKDLDTSTDEKND